MISYFGIVHTAPVLCKEQHGFVPRRSCTSNLAVFLTRAWQVISEGYQTDTVYTDFSAAFQSVNHAYLIHKLEHSYHLRGHFVPFYPIPNNPDEHSASWPGPRLRQGRLLQRLTVRPEKKERRVAANSCWECLPTPAVPNRCPPPGFQPRARAPPNPARVRYRLRL